MSRRGPSPAEKKAIRKRGRAEARARESLEWDEHMVLEPDQLRALLGFLDQQLESTGCEHSLRLTEVWAGQNGVELVALRASLAHFGGGCDCEVLANVDPDSRVDTWARY